MQVSVESTGPLERRIAVEVPAERVEREVDNKLRALGRTAKIKGFRPGKVPLKVVQQQYGDQVRQEVLGDLLQATYSEALDQEKLQPAGRPRIEPEQQAPGEAFRYTAIIEVFPEVKLQGLDQIEVSRPLVEIGDDDVDKLLQRIRRQHAEWEPVERKSADGDQLVVDFEGSIDGEPFEGGKAEKATVELGAGRMLKDFEKGLTGVQAGQDLSFKVNFPKDYNAEHLAGKKAVFKAHVHSVSAPRLPEVDDAFAERLGMSEGGVSRLMEELRKSMEREVEQATQGRVKQQVLDQLYEKNPIELPTPLVDEEIRRLQQDMVQRMGMGEDSQPDLPRELFEEEARKRVALGLLVGEVIREHEIRIEEDRVRQAIGRLVAGQENPEETARAYLSDPDTRRGIEAMVMEEQVVDLLLESATVKDQKTSFEDLVSQGQG